MLCLSWATSIVENLDFESIKVGYDETMNFSKINTEAVGKERFAQ